MRSARLLHSGRPERQTVHPVAYKGMQQKGMHMKAPVFIVAAAAMLGLAAPAAAQLFNSPTFMPPVGVGGPSAYVVDGDGMELGITGAWRGVAGSNLGLRAGFFDTAAGSSIGGGVEIWGALMSASDEFPVDVAWTAAGGAVFGDNVTSVWVPVGVTVGRVFVLEQVTVQPYAHPQVGLGVSFVDVAGNTDTTTDLSVQIDLGAELAWKETWKLRIGLTQGDADTVGIGAAFTI